MIKLPVGLDYSQIITLMKFGSHLYGTDGPDSDTDYKGIYLPTTEQILLQKVPKSYSYKPSKTGEGIKNTKDDVDVEIYSLHYFLKLAIEGQTVAIDMLHASADWPEISSDIWKNLHNNRMMFYTKNLKAFVGYARKQAAKYGIKGSRLAAIKTVLDWIDETRTKHEDYMASLRLSDFWHQLPDCEHTHKDLLPMNGGSSKLGIYQVCGKQYQSTAKLAYVQGIMQKQYDDYGQRAQLAQENKGIDWKAVSHALRAAYQLSQLYEDGDIKFPLIDAPYLKDVKAGLLPWNEVQKTLEYQMKHVEDIAEKSNFPNKVSKTYWNRWLLKILYQKIRRDDE